MLKIKLAGIVRLLTVVLVLGAGDNLAFGQSDGIPRFELSATFRPVGKTKALQGVTVYRMVDGKDEKQGKTGKRGSFSQYLHYGKSYEYRFEHPMYHTVYMEVETSVPQESERLNQEYRFKTIPMFPKTMPDINPQAFAEEPFAVVKFNPESGAFFSDPAIQESFINAISSPVIATTTTNEDSTSVVPDNIEAPENVVVEVSEDDTLPAAPEPIVPDEILPEPTPPEPVNMVSESAEAQTDAAAREAEIEENLRTKRERERELLETAAEDEAGNPAGRGKYFGATSTPDELKIARYQQAAAERERAAQANRNAAAKHDRERAMLLELAQRDMQQKRDSLQRSNGSTYEVKPTVQTKTLEERFKTTTWHIVQFPAERIEYKKVTFPWGQTSYYKNNAAISQEAYENALKKYAAQ